MDAIPGTTWHLASFCALRKDTGDLISDVIGGDGRGQIVYSPDGYMSVQLLEAHPLDPNTGADGIVKGRPGYHAATSYCGSYVLEPASGIDPIIAWINGKKVEIPCAGSVHHDVKISLDPAMESKRQTRNLGVAEIEGKQYIALRPPYPWKLDVGMPRSAKPDAFADCDPE